MGSMYSNLGRGRSGNQVDMRRYTRVFFGFPSARPSKKCSYRGSRLGLRSDCPSRPTPSVCGQPDGQARSPRARKQCSGRLSRPNAAIYPVCRLEWADQVSSGSRITGRTGEVASQVQTCVQSLQVWWLQRQGVWCVLEILDHLAPRTASAHGLALARMPPAPTVDCGVEVIGCDQRPAQRSAGSAIVVRAAPGARTSSQLSFLGSRHAATA